MSRWWRCGGWRDDGEMTGGVELDAGDSDDIVASAGEKTGALDTG